jgi:TetR/AcrR family transcriptional regulator
MATRGRFQRARKPEEKEVRRQAILGAARKLTAEVGANDFSLSELARRSGVSKPNIYRYFESREEVLLQVWVEEVRVLGDRLEDMFADAPDRAVSTTVDVVVLAFEAQPRLCELMGLVAPVLESNLSIEAIVRAKRELAALTMRIAALLHARLPQLSLEDCAWAAGAAAAYVAGMWPSTQSKSHSHVVTTIPELAMLQPVFARDLARLLTALFAGLARRK